MIVEDDVFFDSSIYDLRGLVDVGDWVFDFNIVFDFLEVVKDIL